MACTIARRGAESRRYLGRLDDAEAAAGAGADEDDASALPQRLYDDFDAVRDALFFLLHGGDDLAVLVHHHVDDVAHRRLVDREADGVDGFGGQRLPLGSGRHVCLLTEKRRKVTPLHGSLSNPSARTRTRSAGAGGARSDTDVTISSRARDRGAGRRAHVAS